MRKVELISQLEHIFYKFKDDEDDYVEIFFCGNNKFYKIKLLTIVDSYMKDEVDAIKNNGLNKVMKEFSHNEDVTYIYFLNETTNEIYFKIDNEFKEYCKEITKTEFFKELI